MSAVIFNNYSSEIPLEKKKQSTFSKFTFFPVQQSIFCHKSVSSTDKKIRSLVFLSSLWN